MSKRLLIYAASVAPGKVENFTRQIVSAIDRIDADWDAALLGKAPLTGSKWPTAHFIPLHEVPRPSEETAYTNADLSEFRQIMRDDVPAFDVLYLPSPWGNIPLGMTDHIPAPVVVSIHDLGFEDDDVGMLTDQNRREAFRFAKLASAIVFPDSSLRDRAIQLYGFERERTRVIEYPTGQSDQDGFDGVARRYIKLFEEISRSPWKTRIRQRDHIMVGREERVAWLINHTTLRDAEVPIIRSLGLEVYTSKQVPSGNEVRTVSIDYSEDEHSTLPGWVLDRLNSHNFYENGVPQDIAELLNGYFGTVIVSAFPRPIDDMVSHFKGRILVRVFGREAPHNYTEYLGQLGQGGFWKRVWQIQNRFWFTPSYDSITDIEGKLLRDRAVSLPLALPDRILRSPHRWQGTDRRILFICPRIGSAPEYYGRIYQDFKEHLGHLPHIVGGHQPVPVDDPAVMGFVSDEEMQRWFRDLRVMFYHSREPRHLHYHPLEAVAYGMPLIYMKGGLVEAYMGKDKPGACDTYAEAEEKLRRILDGDEDFVRSVIESQSPLLDTFRPDYVRRMWEERFLGNIMSAAPVPGVLPFHLWRPVPDNTAPETTAETAFQPRRKIGVYLLTANGTGIYKYVTAMLQAAIKLVQGQEWTFDLIWGTHFTFDTSILKLPYPQPEGLTLVPLKARNPIRPFKGWLDVSWWRRSPAYLRLRPLRILVEGILLPVEYVTEVIKGRTLRPRNSRIRSVLSDSRIGRRLLNNRLVQWLLPVSTAADDIYLVNPPPFVKPASFPEIASPPARPYLTLNDVRDMAKQHDVVLFANPFQAISPNVDLDQIQQQPVVITMYDLAHEYTEAWGERSVSISREMAIWGRLAKRVVFGSEYIRNESVKRYNIPYENTRIVRPPPLVIRYTRPDRTEIEVVRTRLNLPERYLLNTGVQGTHKNNLAIFQAMRILRWRGFDVPPLVIGGNESRKMLTGDPTTVYLAVLQQFIRDSGLIIGQDVIIQDFIAEDDLPAVYAGASMGISMSRSESTVHGMILECMLYGTPIIASTIPQNVEQLGTNDEYALLVPPDDAVALADAIQYTLDNPETTQQRVLRATTFIRAKTQEEMAKQFLVIFEEIAASRAANFTR